MTKSPTMLIMLGITWSIFLAAGVSLIWQALMVKSEPTRSRMRGFLNEVKFRLRFATGVVLVIVVISGVVWLLINW
jgi:hypothetical protein